MWPADCSAVCFLHKPDESVKPGDKTGVSVEPEDKVTFDFLFQLLQLLWTNVYSKRLHSLHFWFSLQEL